MRYLLLSILALGSATGTTDKPATSAIAAARQGDAPVITRIVGRSEVIVVRAGAMGPTYAVEGSDGEAIGPATASADLAMKQPALAKTVKTMQANAWAGSD